ncbi:Plastoglobule-localized metallopeptidase 48, chloroplastic [Asimina triloba]
MASSLSILPLFTPPPDQPSCRSSRRTIRTCSSSLCLSKSPISFLSSHPYQSYRKEKEEDACDCRVSVYRASASTASNSRSGSKTTGATETAASSSSYSSSPSSATTPSVSVVFRNLQADDFRHPLDKQNTLLLRTIPGLNELGKALLGPVAEQVMLLENIGTSVLVAENQLPGLHQLMVEAAKILNIEPPDLYVRQNPVPNAYTLAINGRKPFVVIHTSLVELLTRKELQAVLAHELGHLKCDHGVWLTFANILALGAYSVPGLGGLIAQRLEEQLYRWIRAAELTCDRAALLVAQDPKVVISVLMKLAGGCPSLADQLNVDAFLEQARSYDEASSSPVGWYIRNAQTRQLSHPLPVLRAREIDQWSRSREYQSLLRKAMQPSATKKV